MKIGMAMHIMFNSINKCWREFDGNLIVLCLEGRSWRKDFYTLQSEPRVIMDQRSVREQEDDELYFEAYDDMVKLFSEKTNCSVQAMRTSRSRRYDCYMDTTTSR